MFPGLPTQADVECSGRVPDLRKKEEKNSNSVRPGHARRWFRCRCHRSPVALRVQHRGKFRPIQRKSLWQRKARPRECDPRSTLSPRHSGVPLPVGRTAPADQVQNEHEGHARHGKGASQKDHATFESRHST